MSEHTPGPWRIELPMPPHISIVAGGPIDDGTTKYIADIYDFRVPHDPDTDDPRSNVTLEEAWANAHVLKAAPDLLAACERMIGISTVDGGGDPLTEDSWDEAYDQARAAIAKAKGEEVSA